MRSVARVLGRLARFYETDRRERVRVRADFDATITGPLAACRARGVDLHRAGMGVRCDISMAVGTQVYVRIEPERLAGFATVRYCREDQQGGYALGLRLRDGLAREIRY